MSNVYSFFLIPFLGTLYYNAGGRLLLILLYFILFLVSLALIFGREKKNLLALFIGLPLAFLTLHDMWVLLPTVIRI